MPRRMSDARDATSFSQHVFSKRHARNMAPEGRSTNSLAAWCLPDAATLLTPFSLALATHPFLYGPSTLRRYSLGPYLRPSQTGRTIRGVALRTMGVELRAMRLIARGNIGEAYSLLL
jgi:hypothetical protein